MVELVGSPVLKGSHYVRSYRIQTEFVDILQKFLSFSTLSQKSCEMQLADFLSTRQLVNFPQAALGGTTTDK